MTKLPFTVASAEARRAELMGQLERSPVVDIVGVVHARGCGGARSGGRQHWTLSFALAAWRYAGGPVQDRELVIWKEPVNLSEIDVFRGSIRPFKVLKVRARVAETNSFNSPRGLLVEVVATDILDAELCARAQELQNPITFDDERLGTFTLNRAVNWYECRTNWGAAPVLLTLSGDQPIDLVGFDGGESTEALACAHALFRSQAEWDQRIRDFAVAELLDIKNAHWRHEGEREVGADQFKSKMTLESICVYADSSFEFLHHDGALFCGHSILVSGNLAEGPTHADIAG